MKKLVRSSVVILAVLSSSCGVYQANLRNSPMLTKAGEFQGSVQIRRGVEAQGAVAITNHIGAISNYAFYQRDQSGGEFEKRTFFEAGLGYFNNSGNSFFEVFAGYGQGHTQLINQSSMSDHSPYSEAGRFNRFFIQPAIGYRTKKWSTAFVPRISQVNISDYVNTSGNTTSQNKLLFEPAGVTRFYLHNKLFLTFQGGIALEIAKINDGSLGIQLGGGIGFRLNAEKKAESQ
jgi:hypothetical protein